MFPYLRRPDPAHMPPHPIYGKALLTTPRPVLSQDTPIQPDRLLLNLDRISRQLRRSLHRFPKQSSSNHSSPHQQGPEPRQRETTPSKKLLGLKKRLVKARSEAVLRNSQQDVWVFRRVKAGKQSLHNQELQSMLGSIEKSLAQGY